VEDIDYEALDPGIRRLVKLLRDNLFETTDSGDGVSKLEGCPESPVGCAETTANVYIQTTPGALLGETDRLVRVIRRSVRPGLLEETILDPELDQEVPRVIIEGTYLPLEGVAVLAVHGISDKDLLADETRYLA
jgi:hypothetical protein